MNAGLLAYKLCDRNFDCEHCPLDAALRGSDAAHRNGAIRHEPATYPDDRLYTWGHTWLDVHPESGVAARFGIDAFAALLVGSPRRVRSLTDVRPRQAGETICALELEDGDLPLGMPVPGSVTRWNEALLERPESVAADPYDAGWLVELSVGSRDALDELLTSEEARRRARLDVRRFRRHVGWELLLGGNGVDSSVPADDAAITDLHRMLGGARFLSLVQELVH
jgi:glycine cleavage system H protein